jgi:hypothetical protein
MPPPITTTRVWDFMPNAPAYCRKIKREGTWAVNQGAGRSTNWKKLVNSIEEDASALSGPVAFPSNGNGQRRV